MAKLSDLRQIINERLHGVVMTDEQKNEVRRRAAAAPRAASPRRWYAYGAAAVAACLLLTGVLSYGIPRWRANRAESGAAPGSVEESLAQGASAPTTYAAATTAAAATVPATTPAAAGAVTVDKDESAPMGASTTAVTHISAEGLQKLSVSASRSSGAFVAADTSFVITGASAAELGSLRIRPAVPFRLADSADGVVLTPEAPLDGSTVYSISVDGEDGGLRSWAFQTESRLTVVNALPYDGSIGFPTDTGIEITLSSPISDASGFSITPAVTGSLTCEDRTIVFVPDRSLEANTLYTVTLAAGLKADNGAELAEDYSFSFRTPVEDGKPWMYLADSFTESYLPETLSGSPAAITMYASRELDGKDLQVNVYPLASADEYLRLAEVHAASVHPSIGRDGDSLLPVPNAAPVLSFTAQLARQDQNYWGLAHLVFPESPGIGWYLADIVSENGLHLQKLISVSNLAVYAETLNGDALVWVNDAASGSPVQGAGVTVNGVSAVTDAEGTAHFSFGEADYTAPLAVRAPGTGEILYADSITVSGKEETPVSDAYYTFLYTDRSAYLPSDELCFWGRILPRTTGAAIPGELAVFLDGADEGTPEVTVSVAADGSFTGKLSFSNLLSYSHYLDFTADGETVMSSYFTVLDYTKPTYILSLTADKEYYRAGETVTVTAVGTFYDGTPAEGLSVQFHHSSDANGRYGSETVALDKNGRAVYSFVPARDAGSWYPDSVYAGVTTNGAEDVWVSAYTYPRYFRSDTMLELENLSEDGAEPEIRTHFIDFAAFDPETFSGNADAAEALRGAAADVDFLCEIYRCEYIRIPTGRVYDPINKISRETYDYDYRETVIYSHRDRTAGGIGRLPETELPSDSFAWYYIKVTAWPADGAVLQTTLYVTNAFYYPGYASSYFLRQKADNPDTSVGSVIGFELYGDGEAVRSGRMLVSLWHDALLSADVDPAGSYDLTMTESLLPNVIVSGAYFDGRRIYSISQQNIFYRSRERELTVTVEPDRDSYAPGDTVNASITVTDAAGRPVSAPFALGVVDNAAFAVMEQYTDPIETLYQGRYYRFPSGHASYVSHEDAAKAAAEGGGEGGGEGVRDQFKDTAAFLTGSTDAAGHASVSFDLPDNLTSWRLTAVCVAESGGKVSGGKAVHSIPATLPYFLNVVYSKEYLTGDDIALSLRIVGSTALRSAVTATLEGGGISETRELAAGSDFAFVNFGAKPAGLYTLTVRADAGDLHDAVAYPVSVVESRHQIPTVSVFTLSDGMRFDSLRYPVTLTFCDARDLDTLRALNRASVAGTTRLDGALAADLYNRRFLDPDAVLILSDFLSYDGGFRLFSYADSYLSDAPSAGATAETTAWLLMADPTLADAASVRGYLYRVLYDRDSAASEVASAYLGLSVLGEPVLADVRLLLQSGTVTELSEQLTLAAALAELGDAENALAWYDDHAAALGDPTDSDEAFANALRAMLLLQRCGRTEAARALFEAILDTENERVSPAFALVSYLNRSPDENRADAAFSYVLGGETRTVDLSKDRYCTLVLSEAELRSANFRVLSGTVTGSARYVAALSEYARDLAADKTISGGLQVSQRYSVDPDAWETGETGLLNLSVTLPADTDSALVSVVIPSGLRFAGTETNYDSAWYLCGEEAGRVQLVVWKNTRTTRKSAATVDISLRVRAVLPGTFRAEAPVISDLDGHRAFGGEAVVTVR